MTLSCTETDIFSHAGVATERWFAPSDGQILVIDLRDDDDDVGFGGDDDGIEDDDDEDEDEEDELEDDEEFEDDFEDDELEDDELEDEFDDEDDDDEDDDELAFDDEE